MVRKQGQEDGISVWEVNNIDKIESRILTRITDFQFEFEVETIYVMGSFGAGLGVPEKSDLDIIISGIFHGVHSPDELSNLQGKLAEHIMSGQILDGFDEFDGLDLYVHDPSEVHEVLQSYANYEPVETYYNLSEKRIEQY